MASIRTSLCVAVALLCGCHTASRQVPIDSDFNDRLRLDGLALETPQLSEDQSVGPYRIDSGELISPVYPVSGNADLDGRTGNLIQSDCLWLGHDSRHGIGDRIEMSWEQNWTFAEPEDGPSSPASERTLGTCTFSQPVTREFLRADLVGWQGASDDEINPVYAETQSNALTEAEVDGWLPDEPLVMRCATPRRSDGSEGYLCNLSEIKPYSVHLTRFVHDAPDAAANPDGACFSGIVRPVAIRFSANDAVSPVPAEGFFPACTQRGFWRPDRDTQLAISSELWGSSSRSLGPHLMVVDRLRTLRRTMVREQVGTAERWAWQTPTRFNDGQARWEENFSSSLFVSRAKVKLRRQGAAYPLPVNADLCLVTDGGNCRYTCRANAQPSGAVYNLDLASCRDTRAQSIAPDVTPTYDHLLLDAVRGSPQSVPLQWVLLQAPALPTDIDVQIEFDLIARTPNGAALRADHSAFDFGRIPAGTESKHLTTWLRNEGNEPVLIQDIAILDWPQSDPAYTEFDWLVLDQPSPVPMPVDALSLAGVNRIDGITLGDDFDQQPLMQFDVQEKGPLGVLQPVLAATEFELYGQPLRVLGGVLIAPSNDFDYLTAARAESIRQHGLAASHEWPPRFLMREAYRARNGANLPIRLEPGAAVQVAVLAQPDNLGLRQAQLRVRASRASSGSALPQIVLPVRLDSIGAALVDVLPRAISMTANDERQGVWQQNLLINNVGEQDGVLVSLQIEGTDASVFRLSGASATPMVLPVAAPVVLTVQARPARCGSTPQTFHATLLLKMSDGARHAIPLHSLCAP